MGDILNMAIAEAKGIVNDTRGWAVNITMTDNSGTTVTLTGLHTKHHLFLDADGRKMSSKNAHITIDENELKRLSPTYIYRNSDGEVHMYQHLVKVADSTGIVKNYSVEQTFPNERLGLIVFQLVNSDD